MPDTPSSDSSTAASATARARLLTRWIGTGIGAALLITVLALAFSFDCVTSAQSHVLAVVLALGAATLLWGIVGGLKVDLKLKFKALGEVAAGGVAAIFLIVHFVSAKGIIAAEGGCSPVVEQKPDKQLLYGKVFLQGAETKAVQQATVKVETEGVITRTTDEDGSFDIIVPSDVSHLRIWVLKDGFTTSIPIDAELPLAYDKIRIPMVKLIVMGNPPPATEFPTFVEEWDDVLVEADVPTYENAAKVSKADALELANWGRRAHAAGDYAWSTNFFEMAKNADPSGKVWYGDLPYSASAYEKLGRFTEAREAKQDFVDAIRAGDPRLDRVSIREVSQDLGGYDWGAFNPRVPIGPIGPIGPKGINPKGINPKLPTGPIMPGVDPKVPIQPAVPGIGGANKVPFEPVQPGIQPAAPGAAIDPTVPMAQPTTTPRGQPFEPIRLERGVVEPLVQPKPAPKAQPVAPVGR